MHYLHADFCESLRKVKLHLLMKQRITKNHKGSNDGQQPAQSISNEDRAVLMGHATSNMSEHYATPTIARLVEMADLVATTRDTPTLLRIVNG